MHRIVVLALDGVYPFELGIPHRVFGAADGRYDVCTCSVDGGAVRTDSDFAVAVEHDAGVLETADTVIIPPFDPDLITTKLSPAVAGAIARIRPDTRIVSICTGAFVLAATGMLDARRATTHWNLAERFRRMFPKVELDENVLFVDDGDVLTSAGAASGLDLCLHLIRVDHGNALANCVARRCVVPPWRDGGQAQYIEQPVPAGSAHGMAATMHWALERLQHQLTLADLASHAKMSRRTFVRHFENETGVSPGRWLTKQRILRACHLLETTDLSVDQVAREVGFATGASLRQHMHAIVGVSPLAYRRTFRQASSS